MNNLLKRDANYIISFENGAIEAHSKILSGGEVIQVLLSLGPEKLYVSIPTQKGCTIIPSELWLSGITNIIELSDKDVWISDIMALAVEEGKDLEKLTDRMLDMADRRKLTPREVVDQL